MQNKPTCWIAIALVVTALSTFAATPAFAAGAAPAETRVAQKGQLANGILAKLNQIRTSNGLIALALDGHLTASAAQHSNKMAVDGYFAHPSANGRVFWKRIQRYYPSASYSLWSVGENLLWSSGDVDANTALQLWMASPEHRANILDPRWRQIGISSLHATAAPRAYGRLDVTIVTTDFGVRR